MAHKLCNSLLSKFHGSYFKSRASVNGDLSFTEVQKLTIEFELKDGFVNVQAIERC
jgi:hypothetical protein